MKKKKNQLEREVREKEEEFRDDLYDLVAAAQGVSTHNTDGSTGASTSDLCSIQSPIFGFG